MDTQAHLDTIDGADLQRQGTSVATDPDEDAKAAEIRILAALVKHDLSTPAGLEAFDEVAGGHALRRWMRTELVLVRDLVRLLASSMRPGMDGELVRARIAVHAARNYKVDTTKRRLFVLARVQEAIEDFPGAGHVESLQVYVCKECGRRLERTPDAKLCDELQEDGDPCDGIWVDKTEDVTEARRTRTVRELVEHLAGMDGAFRRLEPVKIRATLLRKLSAPRTAAELCQTAGVFDDQTRTMRQVTKLFDEVARQHKRRAASTAATKTAVDPDDIQW